MVEQPDEQPRISDELRQLAEDSAAAEAAHAEPTSAENTDRLVHELRVHQIELEMQNEELRRAQEDLEASRSDYVELFDLAPVGYLTLSDRNIVRNANLTAAHLLGVERAALVGAPFTRYIEPADQDVFYVHHRRLLASGEPQTCDLRLRRGRADAQDASPFWAHVEGRPHTLADGSLAWWVAFSDASERHLAEEALRDSEARFRGYFEQSMVGVAVTSPRRGWLDANQAVCDLLGYSREELTSLTWAQLTHPDDLAADVEQFERVLAGEIDGYRLEKRFIRKDGTVIDTDVSVSCSRNDRGGVGGGGVEHLLTLLSDITERRRAEAEVARLNDDLERRVVERTNDLTIANAELEEFVYSITHDLRSPLRALAGFSELISTDYDSVLDADGQDYLQRIHAAALHMGDVMDALLALSRVNRADLLIDDVDLSATARQIAEELAEEHPERSVEVEIADGLVSSADASLCEVLLRNLLGNAWKFTAGESPAHIRFGPADVDSRQVYCVRDNGVGFDQQYAGRLFRPFERLHTTEEFPGTGIGLATVRRIVNRFGGECWAEGEVGRGAAVYFTIPGAV